MPAIQLYITRDDLLKISEWLNAEKHIALIRADGEHRWRATHDFDIDGAGNWCLFHDLCGPLPLLSSSKDAEDRIIENPFEGWTELRSGADPSTPYFGPGHTGIFRFQVSAKIEDGPLYCSFQWIGNHYSILGNVAPDTAKKWWQRLRRFVLKGAKKVDSQGQLTTRKSSSYWATPDALKKFQS